MVEKGNIQVFPKQFVLECREFRVVSDGTPQHTEIYIDGKRAFGIYDLKIAINTKRPLRCELGVFLRNFTFEIKPKGKEYSNGKDQRDVRERRENIMGQVS
jgi:hypothetical protein